MAVLEAHLDLSPLRLGSCGWTSRAAAPALPCARPAGVAALLPQLPAPVIRAGRSGGRAEAAGLQGARGCRPGVGLSLARAG